MEQVDQIIVVTLRDVGLEIDPDIKSLSNFSTQLVVQSTARCLNIINGKNSVSEKLPENMAGRYRLGIELANACKTLGYKADLGYETFLYSNDTEIRRLLMFLVEKLPRTRQDSDESESHQRSSLKSSVANEIRRQLEQPWLPPACNAGNIVWDGNKKNGNFHYIGGFTPFKSKKLVMSPERPCLGQQCQPSELLSSLLELSTKLNQEIDVSNITFTKAAVSNQSKKSRFEELVKKGCEDTSTPGKELVQKIESLTIEKPAVPVEHNIFKITENLLHGPSSSDNREVVEKEETTVTTKEEDEEELLRQHEAEKEQLQSTLAQLNSKLESSLGKIDNASRRLNDLETSKKKREAEIEALKEEYLLKKKTLQLVPGEKDAVQTMKEKLQAVRAETKSVKEMWVTKESDLKCELEQEEAELKTKELQTAEHISDVKLMREEIAELVSSIEGKEQLLAELEVQVANLPNSINRAAHTKKILDIVTQIKKQKEHITTILSETKVVQKEINALNGKIERSFIVTDEMIFKDAKFNDQCRKAYKLMANLQSEFNALVRGLDDIGTINRELRDVEDLLSREKEKNIVQQTQKLSKDLEALVKDNDKMIDAIKKAKASKR